MEAAFWHQVWKDRNIGFHQQQVYAVLTENIHYLGLKQGDRVFVPLCGKTKDIAWLLGQGYRVVAAELHEAAVIELFEELGVEPEIEQLAKLKRYHFEHIDVYVGDIFDLTKDQIGVVDAIYDRAALIALPESMRRDYATLLNQLSDAAPQLLVIYEYDQSLMAGPPFSVGADEIGALYGQSHSTKKLASPKLIKDFKDGVDGHEAIWVLTSR
ncbi:thiopurine S-methyltransferase [uncultured Pseudoteredinibacter sp.]|uniref:thiopurine S-methyltransferase n=1 Tax=uncultured Pseudoteredinibacter sp. TaxID=1641701 RepID=UPI0026096944|nr:thiopurine S-methyltransferase [uncultured Pseudoteredinibacter sp.]